tara:strand:+ start:5409 stop:5801 length:393 start_codon:yes stop_codon:yes gene_type:complete
MAVTTDNIRDLLNRPKGLTEGTITEMISIRTNEVNKVARGSKYGVQADNQVTTDLKEGAIKMLVALDCLNILINTVPTYYSEDERSVYDRRFAEQIKVYEKRAADALKLVAEGEGSAYASGKTKTRLSTS